MPIQVDDETGVWTTDALPMLYVPRHFFVNNHMGIEEVLGADKYAEILYKAGYKSAWHWCEEGSRVPWHPRRRGVRALHEAPVAARLGPVLRPRSWTWTPAMPRSSSSTSAFVYVYGKVNRKVDYMFTGWFSGAIDQILAAKGSAIRTVTVQEYSGSEEGHDDGLFVHPPK